MSRHIDAVDRAIAQNGEAVTIRRIVPNAPPVDIAALAFVRGYTPDEIAGGIFQGDSKVTLSPTALAGWPAPPRINDRVIAGGRTRNVASVEPVRVGNEVVRYDLRVTG